MKERPIIMGAESVMAILDGRKTQTRRVIKIQPPEEDYQLLTVIDSTRNKDEGCSHWAKLNESKTNIVIDDGRMFRCPYGIIGDRLWIRETWKQVFDTPKVVTYKSSDPTNINGGKWRSPLFMPRWASRITLEITDIKVERLQDITEEGAIAEGIEFDSGWEEQSGEGYCDGVGYMNYETGDLDCITPKESYRTLWNSLNAKRGYSWESNPWVWVISFRVVNNEG
jgi:hypothetical protein